jgi:two-component system, cell cycle sensor histidine kinase and response regulator CckA
LTAPLLRLLLVEDSPDDARLIERKIRESYELQWERVETAAAMREALDRANWDLVVADYSLPRFSAPAALEVLREKGRDIPFIIISGSVREELAVEVMRAGARDFILKDNLKRLNVAVDRELREAAGRRARADAEHALQQSQERLGVLLQSLPMALFTIGVEKESPMSWVSDQIDRICGYPAARFVEEPLFWLSRVHPDDRSRVAESTSKIMQEETAAIEYRWRCADGAYRWFLSEMLLLRDSDGSPREILGVWQDVTERRSLEEQLRQAQKMEAVGRLAGGVAHDFNNLLTTILGYSELVLGRLAPSDPVRGDLQEVRRAAERAAALTGQLLAFSRKQVLQPKAFDLNEGMRNLEKMLGRLIGEDIELTTQLEPSLGTVIADPGQIDQVIMNLAINARDAMPEGGRLAIETANADLDEDYARQHVGVRPGPYVMLAVSDTGVGMDAETRERIFEPFFTTKEPGKGTGLGLAMVYGTVKQSGGNIWVYSEPGHGTTFKIYLPRTDAPAMAAEAGAVRSGGGSETVLLVEDEEPVRRFARRVLESAGYVVIEAPHAEEALRIVSEWTAPIDLLLTDTVMPGMSGPRLASKLRERFPGTKILYTSGYTDAGIAQQGVLDPPAPFLQKPFTPDSLLRKLREALEGEA